MEVFYLIMSVHKLQYAMTSIFWKQQKKHLPLQTAFPRFAILFIPSILASKWRSSKYALGVYSETESKIAADQDTTLLKSLVRLVSKIQNCQKNRVIVIFFEAKACRTTKHIVSKSKWASQMLLVAASVWETLCVFTRSSDGCIVLIFGSLASLDHKPAAFILFAFDYIILASHWLLSGKLKPRRGLPAERFGIARVGYWMRLAVFALTRSYQCKACKWLRVWLLAEPTTRDLSPLPVLSFSPWLDPPPSEHSKQNRYLIW